MYQIIQKSMNPATMNASMGVISECAAVVKSLYSDLNFENPISIAVSFDKTLLTSGYLLHTCVGAVMELFSGYVLGLKVDFCLAPRMTTLVIKSSEFAIGTRKTTPASLDKWRWRLPKFCSVIH